jgi:hypothetical protein
MGFHEGAFVPSLQLCAHLQSSSSAAFASDADRLLYSEHSRNQALGLAALCRSHEVKGAQAVAPCTTAQYMKEETPLFLGP